MKRNKEGEALETFDLERDHEGRNDEREYPKNTKKSLTTEQYLLGYSNLNRSTPTKKVEYQIGDKTVVV